MKRLSALVLMALFSPMLTGCAARIGAEQRRDTNTLVVVEPSDANTINPLYANNEPAFLYYGLILDSLANLDVNYRVIPWLATSWTSTPDHLHYIVHLRHGVQWSDGAPFTSKDVIWTWNAQLDPATGFPYAGQYTYLKDVLPVDTYTIRVDLKNADPLFELQFLNNPILPEHILGKVPNGQQKTTSFGEHPIGTGPYMLDTWQHDQHALFVRNPHWWRGLAKIPKIDVRIVLDEQARIEAMLDGAADLYDSMGSDDYRALKLRAPNLGFVHIGDLYTNFMLVNFKRPGLSDLTVRQAMMYGWDRADVVRGLLHGDAKVSTGIVPSALKLWYDPNVQTYSYDPEKANGILDAAGWHVGRDGVRSKDGTRLEYTLSRPTGSILNTEIAAEFQADMRGVGIKINDKQLDYGTFIDDTNAFGYDLALTGWGGTTDPDEFTFLNSTQLPPAGNDDSGYKDKIVDRDTVMGLKTVDPAQRKVYYDQMQVETAKTLPVLWGYEPYYRAAYLPRLHFNTDQPLPDLYLWTNVFDWTISP